MQDLQEVTHEMHYENFRAECLADGRDAAIRSKSVNSACRVTLPLYVAFAGVSGCSVVM